MSRDGSIAFPWADGDYTFRLGWGELETLQEAVDAGPWTVLDRLATRQCRIGDISHVIRLGLIGGGRTPVEALTLVRDYVEKRPPAENLLHAYSILAIAVQGEPEEPVGEGEAADRQAENA